MYVSSYNCWYFPQNYPKLTNKLKKQKPAFRGVPAFSAVPAFNGGPTTCNSLFCVSTVI